MTYVSVYLFHVILRVLFDKTILFVFEGVGGFGGPPTAAIGALMVVIASRAIKTVCNFMPNYCPNSRII